VIKYILAIMLLFNLVTNFTPAYATYYNEPAQPEPSPSPSTEPSVSRDRDKNQGDTNQCDRHNFVPCPMNGSGDGVTVHSTTPTHPYNR
jgi:hypothetical protein